MPGKISRIRSLAVGYNYRMFAILQIYLAIAKRVTLWADC